MPTMSYIPRKRPIIRTTVHDSTRRMMAELAEDGRYGDSLGRVCDTAIRQLYQRYQREMLRRKRGA